MATIFGYELGVIGPQGGDNPNETQNAPVKSDFTMGDDIIPFMGITNGTTFTNKSGDTWTFGNVTGANTINSANNTCVIDGKSYSHPNDELFLGIRYNAASTVKYEKGSFMFVANSSEGNPRIGHPTRVSTAKTPYLTANDNSGGWVDIIDGVPQWTEKDLNGHVWKAFAIFCAREVYSQQPSKDNDPYSGIDGEGNIPGGGSVEIPSFPQLSSTSTGIVGLFAPSPSQMAALADYMWTDFGGTGTDVTGVLKEIVEALKRSISNPLDYVIGLNIIPSQGLSIGESSVIKFGFTSSGVSMPRLSNQFFTVDCGSLSFPTLCGDTFLDYAPYSKFSIYLPYIGFKDVDANDFVGHTIGVIYHGDTVTGGVTAYITKDGSVMYQYSGCCALNIPLSADNWGNTISGAVQIATSLVAGATIGGAAGVGMAAAKGAANVSANPSLLSPQVSHSGAVSGGAGCMAIQYPFVIREAVRFHSTAGFNKFSGYPSYYNRSLKDVHGFTTVFDVHLENIPATNGEIAEIENLLKSGVIL